jgi:hypothetical protein
MDTFGKDRTLNIKRTVTLTPPLLGAEHIKEKITCIRAHRERIFQVYTQKTESKLICHDYGQGGAGWTFLFGCVNESIRQFQRAVQEDASLAKQPICVIGAGCYGLLTAIMLARAGYAVRIVTKDTQNLPSDKAAGFFFPRARKCSTPQERAIFLSYGMESYRTYLQIINGDHPFITQGPKLLPAYYGLDIDPGFAPYITDGLVAHPEQVTIDFGNGKRYEALEYQTIFINSTAMMHELQRNAQELGISIEKKEIESFDEIPEPIIFNCTSLGAKKLTGDTRLIPVQGHLIALANQPKPEELQYLINVKVIMPSVKGTPRDELIYFAPKDQGILGITFIRGQDNPAANQHEFDRLLQRCKDYFGTK